MSFHHKGLECTWAFGLPSRAAAQGNQPMISELRKFCSSWCSEGFMKKTLVFSRLFAVLVPLILLPSVYCSGMELKLIFFLYCCQLSSLSNIQRLFSWLLIQVQEILVSDNYLNGQVILPECMLPEFMCSQE